MESKFKEQKIITYQKKKKKQEKELSKRFCSPYVAVFFNNRPVDRPVGRWNMGDGEKGGFTVSKEMEVFLCQRLLDRNLPISDRFRALFSLRNLKGPAPRDALISGGISFSFYSLITDEIGNGLGWFDA